MKLSYGTFIDFSELQTFAYEWLWMGFPAGYNFADFYGYAILASQWLHNGP